MVVVVSWWCVKPGPPPKTCKHAGERAYINNYALVCACVRVNGASHGVYAICIACSHILGSKTLPSLCRLVPMFILSYALDTALYYIHSLRLAERTTFAEHTRCKSLAIVRLSRV